MKIETFVEPHICEGAIKQTGRNYLPPSCSKHAHFEVNGKMMCEMHAGRAAIEALGLMYKDGMGRCGALTTASSSDHKQCWNLAHYELPGGERRCEWHAGQFLIRQAKEELRQKIAREEGKEVRRFSPWIGVDLDGTLAFYDHWRSYDHIGEPLAPMVERVKGWLAQKIDVRIFTARMLWPPNRVEFCRVTGVRFTGKDVARIVGDWSEKHIGVRLPVTCVKDVGMIELWDDRAIQVVPNTGQSLADAHAAELSALKGKP